MAAATAVRDAGADLFDVLTAVDEQEAGFDVVLHLWSPAAGRRCCCAPVPPDDPRVPSLTGVFAGAAWHERETAEMFGLGFDGHPGLDAAAAARRLRGRAAAQGFVLAARVATAWPGAPEPGQSSAEAAPGGVRRCRPASRAPGSWPAGERA